jgi:hypothetical protein
LIVIVSAALDRGRVARRIVVLRADVDLFVNSVTQLETV